MHIEKDFEDLLNKRPESSQEAGIIELLKRHKENSTSGNKESRDIIKSHIRTKLLTSFNIYGQEVNGRLLDSILFECIKLEEASSLVDAIISFENLEELTAAEKFSILLHVLDSKEGKGRSSAFNSLMQRYEFFSKQRSNADYTSVRYEYSQEDIDFIFKNENISLSFMDKMDIIVQLVYEKIFGLMCLDSLAYSDVNEVGFANDGKYIYCWSDKKIWLSFLTLSEEEARVVQDRAISFDRSIGQLDRNNPEKLCHRSDGARITVTQPPYFSARNLCIRIFNKSNASYNELEKSERIKLLTTALIKAGESICIQGALGTGKTTKMETMFEILDDCLHIGTVEDYFEQQIARKYPLKRIVEAQAINNKSLLDAVKTLLRMSVDVADLGEVRDGNALFAFIQLVQSVSVAAWFTTHIVNPDTTVPRLKNMLMGTGRYLTEQAAIMDIIHYVNIIFQHDIIDGRRMISKIVEIVPLVAASSEYDGDIGVENSAEELQKLFYLQQIKSSPSNMYRLNTILDTVDGEARFVSYPSNRLLMKLSKNKNTKELAEKLLNIIKMDLEAGYYDEN